ncbi:hypothetical protein GOBAR_DD00054 [Gossypium barbadense]|nr:hypothetical protein GOBAR_DD00054 [Gossypium barbadense]
MHFLHISSALSRWCITHRKKAKQIVETWDKLFNSSQKERRVSFLYLANDILQNSRRKGSEFVNEFWKVLPVALKHVYDDGDEYGKKAVARLKLAVGGLPEKILTAYQSVLEDNPSEDTVLNKCNAAVQNLSKLEENAESSLAQGNQNGSALLDELQLQENALRQCVEQLESIEATRAALVFQLKEALQEQESKLELICSQLQVARGQIEQGSNLRKRLTLPSVHGHVTTTSIPTGEAVAVSERNLPSAQPSGTLPQPLLPLPMISFAPSKTTEEDNKKAAAAAVAAKLAASTSSAQMLTSVLSSLVAEEAASMNGSLKSGGFTSGLSMFPPEKRPKLEKPMPVSDASDIPSTTHFNPLQQQAINNMPLAPSTGMQPMSQGNQIQAPFASAPPPPLSPANPSGSQYMLSTGMMMGVQPVNRYNRSSTLYFLDKIIKAECGHSCSVLHVELWAIHDALLLARDAGFHHVALENSLLAIQMIHESDDYVNSIALDLSIQDFWRQVSFHHIVRDSNRVSDTLANL